MDPIDRAQAMTELQMNAKRLTLAYEAHGEGRVEYSDIIIRLSDALDVLRGLPSAEPEKEKAKRVMWTGWKGYRDTRYKCPNCKKPVKNDDIYCHRCGQRLMFPHISFTDYIPGEKQETIVRWDDE